MIEMATHNVSIPYHNTENFAHPGYAINDNTMTAVCTRKRCIHTRIITIHKFS